MKYIITLPALLASLLLLCLTRSGPALAQFSVDTTLGGLPLKTTVDTAMAQAMLMETSGTRTAKDILCHSANTLPKLDRLEALTRHHSLDTAMAALAKCLLQMPQVAQAQQLFMEQINASEEQLLATAELLSRKSGEYVVIFVPGWGYQSPDNPTGADLAMPQAVVQAQGFSTRFAAIPGNGSVEEGAAIVSALAREELATGKRVLFVSASSGGPIVAHAITTGGFDDHPGLAGWLNICGVLNGSPTIDSLLFWPATLVLRGIALLEGWQYDNLLSLSRKRSVPRFRQFEPPPQLTIVNYIGLPFSDQVSRYGRLFHRLLGRRGPNDGLTFITDALAPGYTVLGIGSDHFIMEDPDITHKTGALLPVLLQLIEHDLPSKAERLLR